MTIRLDKLTLEAVREAAERNREAGDWVAENPVKPLDLSTLDAGEASTPPVDTTPPQAAPRRKPRT